MQKISDQEEAEMLAIEALDYMAQTRELLELFMTLTGISASDLRQAAFAPGFLAGVLGFLLDQEPALLAFCLASGREPQSVKQAFSLLPGGGRETD